MKLKFQITLDLVVDEDDVADLDLCDLERDIAEEAERLRSDILNGGHGIIDAYVEHEEVEDVGYETNTEFFRRVCEDDARKGGAMTQAFALDAVAKQAKAIAEMPLAELAAEMGENSFISPALWKGCAEDWHDAFQKRGL